MKPIELLTAIGIAVLLGGYVSVQPSQAKQEAALVNPSSKPFLNLRDYGAVGDGKADDSPALQKALDALATAGGGRLVIPPGKFLIKTPVDKDFINKASAIRIEGSGSAAQLIINVGEKPALRMVNVEHLTFEGVTFVGMPKVPIDASYVVVVGGSEVNTFRDCNFYGLSGGPAIYASQTDLVVSRCTFLGCNNRKGGMIQNHQWRGVLVENSRFIDYGNLNGDYRDIEGIGAEAWVLCEDPSTYPISAARHQNTVTVRNTVMDEGATYGVLINPSKGRVSRVHIDDVQVNVNKVGLCLRNVDYAVIENSFIGYRTGPVCDAVRLESVIRARLERVLCLQSANRITADKACATLVLEDCEYTTLSSEAKKTFGGKD